MKYMGSKSRIAKDIVPIISDLIISNGVRGYIEPFVGGANVIDKISHPVRVGTDINRYLIALLQRVQSGDELYDSVPKELYDAARIAWRAQDDSFPDWALGNIGFLASYNGRFFDGGYAKSGNEHLSNGDIRFRDYYQESKANLLSQDLAGIHFSCCDYTAWSNTKAVQTGGYLIYCDPPYAGTKCYAASSRFDFNAFWGTIREWSVNNIVLVSEMSAPDDFECIWEKSVSRSIWSTDKSRATEKLFRLKST